MLRFMLCIWKVLPPSLVENELHCLIPQDVAEPKKGGGMTKKVADLLVDVLSEVGVRRI